MAKRRCCSSWEPTRAKRRCGCSSPGSDISSGSGFVNWANLCPEMLEVILDKLFDNPDYIRFGAVCRSWNAVAISQKQKRIEDLHKQPPMYFCLRPPKGSDRTQYDKDGYFKLNFRPHLLHVGERKVYKCDLSKFIADDAKVCCYGSSYGWLILRNKGDSIILCNPFNQQSVKLPDYPGEYGRLYKIILSCDPTRNLDNLVVAALGLRTIALTKPGNRYWYKTNILMKCGLSYPLVDIMFHKGLLYGVDCFHQLMAIDYIRKPYIKYSPVSIVSKEEEEVRGYISLKELPLTILSESMSGELLMILKPRHSDQELGVYKVGTNQEASGQKMGWVEVPKSEMKDTRIVSCDRTVLCVEDHSGYRFGWIPSRRRLGLTLVSPPLY